MILLQRQASIHLEQPISKINSLFIAYNNTHVASAVLRPGKTQAIIHFDEKGGVLGQWEYDFEMGPCGMLGEKEVIVLNKEESTIDIIHLEGSSISRVNHQFGQQDMDHIDLVIFYESKSFCIVQSYTETCSMRLTYYGRQGGDIVQLSEFEQRNEEPLQGSGQFIILKGDEHSKVIWLLQMQRLAFQFFTFDLREGCKLHGFQSIGDGQFLVRNMRQTKEGIFSMICDNINPLKDEEPSMLNYTFVFDIKMGTVKHANYSLIQKLTICSHPIMHTLFLGKHSLFLLAPPQPLQSKAPLIYVDNETEKIVSEDVWDNSCYMNLSVVDDSTLLMGRYDNGDVRDISVRVMRMSEMREVALHFMLHLNEDFADDLLQDAMDILPYH